MKRILTVIGARPQIIKAAALSRAIRRKHRGTLEEHLLHTGQHYDEKMSAVFFEEMEIPPPDYRLEVGSGHHGAQTARMIEGIEKVLCNTPFDAVVTYGDTNSTLAAALAAAKMHIPVVHIEAGLRSFNKSMPEELNRIACDHCSTLLFSPTATGIENLKREGFPDTQEPPYTIDKPGVFHCGDVMFDNTIYFSELAEKKAKLHLPLQHKHYILATIHRPYNTDDVNRLEAILSDMVWLVDESQHDLVLPLHPRTKSKLTQENSPVLKVLEENPAIHLLEPVSFLEMLYLEKHAKMLITDSGGVQKEAFFFGKPSVVLRSETEWVEIVEHGSATLAFETGSAMRTAFQSALHRKHSDFPPIFGDGKAAEFICDTILKHI